MGHERVGTLPKTQRWRNVVAQIADWDESPTQVSDIARSVIQNLRSRFRHIQSDDGVKAAFEFLVALSISSRSQDPHQELLALVFDIPSVPTPLSLAKAVNKWVESRSGSLEYSQVARSAAIDAIAIWSEKNKPQQTRLFEFTDRSFDIWRKAGNGIGFCELARTFFAKFTERYLNYFLEREASAVLKTIGQRDEFHIEVQEHADQISRHAFETAKITQSFAAGWFNKHTIGGMPSEDAIEGFLSIAFGKIREELLREGEKQ